MHSTPPLRVQARADARGDLSAQVTVPDDVRFGGHRLDVVGVGANGQLRTAIGALRVIAFSTPAPVNNSHQTRTLILVGIALGLPFGTWLYLRLAGSRHGPLGPGSPT